MSRKTGKRKILRPWRDVTAARSIPRQNTAAQQKWRDFQTFAEAPKIEDSTKSKNFFAGTL